MLTSIKKILCTKNPLQRYPFFFTHLQYYSDFFPTNVWAFTGWCVLPFSLRSIPTSRSESRAKAEWGQLCKTRNPTHYIAIPKTQKNRVPLSTKNVGHDDNNNNNKDMPTYPLRGQIRTLNPSKKAISHL